MPKSNQPKQAELKASIADLVGPLLKDLKQAKRFSQDSDIIEKFSAKFENLQGHLAERKSSERELITCIGDIQKWIENKNVSSENKQHTDLMATLDKILTKLKYEPRKNPQNTRNQSDENEPGMREASNGDDEENEGHSELVELMNGLSYKLQNCMYSLCVFPANTELKKRLLIYWWVSLFFDPSSEKETAETFGQDVFSKLEKKGILIPVLREHNEKVDRCTVEPRIHRQLITACKNQRLFECKPRVPAEEGNWHIYKDDGEPKALLNLDQKYLNFGDISDNISDMQIVQLGRWRYTDPEVQDEVQNTGTEVKSKDHIEVDETEFLKKVGEKTTYLSFHGISGIQQLPESVGKLRNLKILDLRACHNLETLPEKTKPILQKISRWPSPNWFKNLTHLDITECYLLDHMPKWVSELSNLEMLKGFVVSSGASNKQFCRLADLSELKKLVKLSIKVANNNLVQEELNGLKKLDKLLVLTIIWGLHEQSTVPKHQTSDQGKENHDTEKNQTNAGQSRENANDSLSNSEAGGGQNPVVRKDKTKEDEKKSRKNEKEKQKKEEIKNSEPKKLSISFPKQLKKLDIRCYPYVEASEMLNLKELESLERLYIRGGKLTNIGNIPVCEVKILRLRFLENLEIDGSLLKSFKKLNYLECEGCPKQFPQGVSRWRSEIDPPLPEWLMAIRSNTTTMGVGCSSNA